MYDLVIRSARIVTPDGVVMGDLAVNKEKIAAIGQGLGPGEHEVDATGRIVFPGIIDAHVHFNLPVKNIMSADDVESGTRSAAFGGVTTVIDFTQQNRGESLKTAFERRVKTIDSKSYVDVALHSNITSISDAIIAEIPELVKLGTPSFKVFTAYRDAGMHLNDPELLRVADAVGRANGLLMVHAENGDAADFITERCDRAGQTKPTQHGVSRPDLLEAEAIYRIATLANIADCPLYVVHVSSDRGMQVIRNFRNEGWTIHAETCPHYLLLDESSYEGEEGTYFITTPPLRTREDCTRLTAAVAEGEIQVVATDHCPFTRKQMDEVGGKFNKALNGLPGVETLFPLMFSHLVALADGGLTPRSNASLILLARVLAENPAKLFGLAPAKGALREGADADFIVFDPNPIRHVNAMDLHGNADWNPYAGSEVRGELRTVYLRGQRIIENGQLYGKPGIGQFVPGKMTADS
ncbi:MAG: dihydropyrimidinase [bacterium]|nr:dihydropyrimidinase [bacterium]